MQTADAPAVAGGKASGDPKGAVGGGKSNRGKPNLLVVKGGRRAMKGYTVTGDELVSLGLAQGGAAVSFALAGSASGFWLSTKQALDLAGSDAVAVAKKAEWQAYGNVAFYGAIALFVLALALFAFSGWRVWRIKKDTIHD